MLETVENKLLTGGSITRDEALSLSELNDDSLPKLLNLADKVKRKHSGNSLELCSIVAAKVGLCPEDCKYCAQSVHNSCRIQAAGLMDAGEVLRHAKGMETAGVRRFSLVTSGEKPSVDEFEKILRIYRRLHTETKFDLCASLGTIDADMAMALKAAGVTMYHHNIEASRSYFPHICTTHTYDDRINTVKTVKKAGLKVCSGGIIGMGETMAQRLEMAFELRDLGVDSAPVNILNPIPGTPLENAGALCTGEILRTIALFRLILPDVTIRLAGGREKGLGSEERRAFSAGVGGVMVGGYLTTGGKHIEDDLQLFKELGLEF